MDAAHKVMAGVNECNIRPQVVVVSRLEFNIGLIAGPKSFSRLCHRAVVVADKA
jgi:hypothetical protein